MPGLFYGALLEANFFNIRGSSLLNVARIGKFLRISS